MRKILFISVALLFGAYTFAQNNGGLTNGDGSRDVNLLGDFDSPRIITTAVPFLGINTDSRGGGMGDVGAATSPTANAVYWNPSKLAFIDKDYGVSLSYVPWLRNLVQDMSLSTINGYYKISKLETVAFNFKYFNLGSITYTDEQGNTTGEGAPSEYTIGVHYARKLSDVLSVSVGAKYIRSNLLDNIGAAALSVSSVKPGNGGAADIGIYYNKDVFFSTKEGKIAAGAAITNAGNKISYTSSSESDFIPTTLRLGVAYTHIIDPFNKFTFAADASKLLVPTPPVYLLKNGSSVDSTDENGDRIILQGQDPNRTFINGMFTSFGDAPGGFREETQEIMYSAGVEYLYNEMFALRAGLFREHERKGNRKFYTFGFGIMYQVFAFDFSYLFTPEGGNRNPLANTLRFTISMNFDKPEDSAKNKKPNINSNSN